MLVELSLSEIHCQKTVFIHLQETHVSRSIGNVNHSKLEYNTLILFLYSLLLCSSTQQYIRKLEKKIILRM